MENFIWEAILEDPIREAYAQCVWNDTKILERGTKVEDRERGELNPSYLEWFYNRDALTDRPRTVVKSTAEWEAEIRNRVGLAAEEMKMGYESDFRALQEELGIIKVDMDLLYDAFEKEKAQWAREKQALKAQIQKTNIFTTAQQQEERET